MAKWPVATIVTVIAVGLPLGLTDGGTVLGTAQNYDTDDNKQNLTRQGVVFETHAETAC